jgi:hypothetical protein
MMNGTLLLIQAKFRADEFGNEIKKEIVFLVRTITLDHLMQLLKKLPQ